MQRRTDEHAAEAGGPVAARPSSDINVRVADLFRAAAALLEAQGANPFRIGAYRRAADTVAALGRPVDRIYRDQGIEGLIALPGIGESLAAAIRQIVTTGRWSQLERLRGALDPERLFQTVPGVGPELARRIHDELHVDTLEALEVAAHDGRLDAVPGIGRRRVAILRAALADMLGRVRTRTLPAAGAAAGRPDVATLLDVDRDYRSQAKAGRLSKIAPRRFNPSGEAWLPILHAVRGAWHFTALFSNTARAHELGRTHDWVVLYYYDGDHREGQCTVVSESRGPLAGRRVVRGREAECRAYYGAG